MIRLTKKISSVLMVVLMVVSLSTVWADEDVPSRVIITDFFIEGGGLEAGGISMAVFMLKNTSETANVNSVLLTGSIDTTAPLELVGTNQAYVRLIPPGGEVEVEFEYYTRNVDLTSIDCISVGFTIHYGDEGTGVERMNSVTLRLPVLRNANTAVDEADMLWPVPQDSALDEFLYSRLMQAAYAAGLVICCVGIAVLLLFKMGILRFKR